MKFFTKKMIENAGKFVNDVISNVSKNTQKTPVVKTICGKTVALDGDISVFGTSPGSMRYRISRHDNASKIKAYQDAEKISKAGSIPQIDITWSSRYTSDGDGTEHTYTWHTKEVCAETQDDPNNAPHV
jgi:hypothetical protein